MPEDSAEFETVIQYVRDGPDAAGDSLLRRTLAVFVWWKMWVAALLGVVASVVVGAVVGGVAP